MSELAQCGDSRYHNNLDALVWLDTSAEQAALYRQAFSLAKRIVLEGISKAKAENDNRPLCVFSDIDETLLDNSPHNAYLVRTGRNFHETGTWNQWCVEAIAKPTPGAVAFMQYLERCRDHIGREIEIFYVTSRLDHYERDGVKTDDVRVATGKNLSDQGFPIKDASTDPEKTHLFMKKQLINGEETRKEAQYEYIMNERDGGYRPLMWLGDNLGDFSEAFNKKVPHTDREAAVHSDEFLETWGSKYVVMPNPVYGSWAMSHGQSDDACSANYTPEPVRTATTPSDAPKLGLVEPWCPKS